MNLSGYMIFNEYNMLVQPERCYLVKASDIIDEGPSSPGINEAKQKGIKLSTLFDLRPNIQQ
jgi:hypothetical protein